MPERPDLDLYVEHLRARLIGRHLRRLHVVTPFVLRSVAPPPEAFAGARTSAVARLGKRLVLTFDVGGEILHAAAHLMIAGRLRWLAPDAALPRRGALVGFDYDHGRLVLTEAGRKKRAALHLLSGADAPAALHPGGVEVDPANPEAFRNALRRENHTLKRALTDQRILLGIGNAYSDEILWRAGLSPFRLTHQLDAATMAHLFEVTCAVLAEWTERLRRAAGDAFPERVTAFRPEMAVHGKYRQPCLRCGTPIQRIVFAETESDYCPRCQTGGRVLADRALSRLLKDNWPRRVEDLEAGGDPR